jgi:3-methyladenine DNA glycosylase AlkD
MSASTSRLVRFVQARLRAAADSARAAAMQAYMKTDMPYYGVARPAQRVIFREMARQFPPAGQREYEAGVRALWQLAYRETRYAAIDYAAYHKQFVTLRSLKLYERLVRDAQWWDLVDGVAVWLVSPVYLAQRERVRPTIERWIDDPDLWIRRTALLAHNIHKAATDRRQLFDHCLRRADEQEFFIRKAIGWALRQYSYANPKSVRRFLLAHRDRLSGLSFREGSRQLVRSGWMD